VGAIVVRGPDWDWGDQDGMFCCYLFTRDSMLSPLSLCSRQFELQYFDFSVTLCFRFYADKQTSQLGT